MKLLMIIYHNYNLFPSRKIFFLHRVADGNNEHELEHAAEKLVSSKTPRPHFALFKTHLQFHL